MPNFTKIHPMVPEFFYAEGRKDDRHDEYCRSALN
jgi:hypothetical protein